MRAATKVKVINESLVIEGGLIVLVKRPAAESAIEASAPEGLIQVVGKALNITSGEFLGDGDHFFECGRGLSDQGFVVDQHEVVTIVIGNAPEGTGNDWRDQERREELTEEGIVEQMHPSEQ